MAYRRDIDGLRALAVLLVLLFHLNFAWFSGGYVGVDIFFVISGYLITSILRREIAEGRFSLLRFYERRIRRIFPALFVMLGVVFLFSLMTFVPEEMMGRAKGIISVALFSSNIWFWHNTGYFDADAEGSPLVHTWSLGIEEQFYILFPIFLASLQILGPRSRFRAVALVAAISLAASIIVTPERPTAAFYLLPTRAWELLVGSILALRPNHLRQPWLREVIAACGLVCIVAAALLFTRDTLFPGWSALLPTIGAAALIQSGEGTRVGNFLGKPIPVGIGLISYSLYLVHWPLIVITSTYVDPTLLFQLTLIVLSLALAYLSWRFVEMPMRSATIPMLPFGGACIATAIGIGALTLAYDGFPGRFSPAVNAMLAETQSELRDQDRRFSCARIPFDNIPDFGPCPIGAAGRPSVVVYGDSHAMVLRDLLDALLRAEGVAGALVAVPGCPPAFGLDRLSYGTSCGRRSARVQRYLVETAPKILILIGKWRGALKSQNTRYRGVDSFDDASRTANVRAALTDTVASLHSTGIEVAFAYPVPGADRSVPEALARNVSDIEWLRPEHHAVIDALSGIPGMDLAVDLSQPFCNALQCDVADAYGPLYFDQTHLTRRGIEHLRPVMERFIADVVARLRDG